MSPQRSSQTVSHAFTKSCLLSQHKMYLWLKYSWIMLSYTAKIKTWKLCSASAGLTKIYLFISLHQLQVTCHILDLTSKSSLDLDHNRYFRFPTLKCNFLPVVKSTSIKSLHRRVVAEFVIWFFKYCILSPAFQIKSYDVFLFFFPMWLLSGYVFKIRWAVGVTAKSKHQSIIII